MNKINFDDIDSMFDDNARILDSAYIEKVWKGVTILANQWVDYKRKISHIIKFLELAGYQQVLDKTFDHEYRDLDLNFIAKTNEFVTFYDPEISEHKRSLPKFAWFRLTLRTIHLAPPEHIQDLRASLGWFTSSANFLEVVKRGKEFSRMGAADPPILESIKTGKNRPIVIEIVDGKYPALYALLVSIIQKVSQLHPKDEQNKKQFPLDGTIWKKFFVKAGWAIDSLRETTFNPFDGDEGYQLVVTSPNEKFRIEIFIGYHMINIIVDIAATEYQRESERWIHAANADIEHFYWDARFE